MVYFIYQSNHFDLQQCVRRTQQHLTSTLVELEETRTELVQSNTTLEAAQKQLDVLRIRLFSGGARGNSY